MTIHDFQMWLCRRFGRVIFTKGEYIESNKRWVETMAWFFRRNTLVVSSVNEVTEGGNHVLVGQTRLMWNDPDVEMNIKDFHDHTVASARMRT